eukprot:COSAG04_NODE_3251_length_3007_cov_1.674691_3_plen_139_part_00
MQLAAELLLRGRHEPIALGLLREIRGHGEAAAGAELVEARHGRLAGAGVARADADARTVCGIASGNHEADTATAAGDDDVLTRDGEQVGRQELLLVDLNLRVVEMALARRRADLQPERRRLLRLALLLQLREQAAGCG